MVEQLGEVCDMISCQLIADLLPLPDFHPGTRGVPLSPPEGPASGGELSRAVLHPSVHPEGLPGVSVLRGGKPV